MFVPVKAKADFCGVHHKNLIVASLLIVVLVSSLCVCVFMNNSNGASLTNAVHVKNETELKNTINNSSSKGTTIALDNDITLTDTLTISTGKDITLASNKPSGFYKLIGATDKSTITVEGDSVLRLDGIIVTHVSSAGETAGGISVGIDGLLIMYKGEISGNTVTGEAIPYRPGDYEHSSGGGVHNYGVFEMYGGKISNNHAAINGYGGGVFNLGSFKMSGGEISDNTVSINGGGVFNAANSSFEMSGGKISGNTANWGGGVYNYGSFSMSGGEISGNKGGVVSSGYGTFDRFGGRISGNIDYNVYSEDIGDGTYGGSDGVNNGQGGESSNGNNGTSDGNNGSPDYNGGANNGNNEQIIGSFSLRDFVIVGVGVVGIIIGIVGVVLFFASKKQLGV